MPDAERVRLPATDGGRWGLLGWVTLAPRPDRPAELHAASRTGGLDGAFDSALREASSALRIDRRGPERRELGPTEVDTLQAALAAALERRGIELVALDVDSVDFLAVGPGTRPGPPPDDVRVLVVGLDGADWAILDPLIAAGRLPTLERLVRRGARGRLLSISPMLSPVIWTSMATGVEPTRHGILDFLVSGPDGTAQPVTAAQRQVPTVWELLSDDGVDVGVVGWWASWPAAPVRGYLVSDRLAYQLFGYRADPEDAEGKTWPPDLYGSIRPLVAEPQGIDPSRVRALLGADPAGMTLDADARGRLNELRTLLASGDTYLAVASSLAERFEPRFETLYLEGTDTIGHLFMQYRPPTLPGIDPDEARLFGDVVDRYYEAIDAQLGRFLEDRGDDWTVLVVSDHGFASDATRPRNADPRIGHGAAAEWHRRFGVVLLSGAHVAVGASIEQASIYDIAPTVMALFGRPVPRDWPGRVLAEAIDPAFLDRHPVRYDDRPAATRAVARSAIDDPNAAELMAKLESLGYVSAGGAGAAVTAVNNAAVALMGQGRYEEAEAEFRRGLADNPDSPMLEMNLGLCLTLQGRGDEATPYFERVLASGAGGASASLAAVQLARIRFDAGRVDEAARLVTGVLELEPDAADALTLSGELALARGEPDAAERAWRRAAEVDPAAASARNELGTLYRARGDAADAERWYLEAIEADPYFMGAYNNLALVYQASGRIEQARDLYRRALVRTPDHPTVLNNLATLQLATGRTARAAELWRRAADADPDYPSPLSNLAGLAIADGRLDDALELLLRAIDLDPNYGDAWMNRALIHLRRDELDAARAALESAARDLTVARRALFELGALELQTDRPAAAVRALEVAADLAPDDVELLNALGEALRRAGRPDEAAARWRRSLELRPEQPAVRRRLATL